MRRTAHTSLVIQTLGLGIILLLLPSCDSGPGNNDDSKPPATSPTTRPAATRPAAETILLHSRDAVVHGKTLRYEPDPKKNTLGYWTDVADWASWEFTVNHPGKYAVEILQ